MNSKSDKRVKKVKSLNKHLNYLIDCDLNQTNDKKTDKIRSKIFQLNATKDDFNSQKAFDDNRLKLTAQLTEELDRSDGKNTYLTEELIEFSSSGRPDRPLAQFASQLYLLNEQQICQQMALKQDISDSDECQVIGVILNKPSDNGITGNHQSDGHKKNNSLKDRKEVKELVYNCGESVKKTNLLNRLGSFQKGFPQPRLSQKKSSNSNSSESTKFSTSSPKRVVGISRTMNSPQNQKRDKPEDCAGSAPKKSFITGLQKKVVDDFKKNGDLKSAKRTLNSVNSFRLPLRDNQPMSGFTANDPDFEDDPNLKNIDKKLIEKIESEIITALDAIQWEDVAGLEFAKKKINEIAILPLKKPHLFTGLRAPPKGILLFGPPGTGKTLLGRLIASQTNSTFFSITVSALNSKWIGEGEKTIKAMFAVARARKPSVIFIDEIDSLLTTRSDTEHESSRRMKTEFFTQFEGVTTASVDNILIIGATNRPQDLDDAARRRLTARLYIRLPDLKARIQMIKNCLKTETHDLKDNEIQTLAQKTEGYSGADMRELCRESAMEVIRDLDVSIDDSDPHLRAITFEDFSNNLNKVKPSVLQEDLQQFEDWNRQFGTV